MMTRKTHVLAASVLATSIGALPAGAGDLNWVGGANGAIAASPDNWSEGRRPGANDHLYFSDQGINGSSPCVFAEAPAADYIERVRAMTIRDQAQMDFFGGLFDADLPDEPNIRLTALTNSGFMTIKPNLWMQLDDLVNTNGLVAVEGRMDVQGVFRNWTNLVVYPTGQLNVAGERSVLHAYNVALGGQMNFAGDVDIWHQDNGSFSSLMMWEDTQTGQPSEITIDGTLTISDGPGTLTLLLDESELKVGGLDLRHAKASYPNQAGQDLNFRSGLIEITGGALQVPDDADWSFGPQNIARADERNLDVHLRNGASFEHLRSVSVGGGRQSEDQACRGRLLLTGDSDFPVTRALTGSLTVGDAPGESGWMRMFGHTDLEVRGTCTIGDGGIGGLEFETNWGDPGNPRPVGEIWDRLWIGRNGSPQAEMSISYGEVRARDNVYLGVENSTSRLSVYSLGAPNPDASHLNIDGDLEIGWDLWSARNHGPSTVVAFGGGRIDVDGVMGLGTTSELYLGTESNFLCDSAVIAESGNVSMMGGDLEISGLVSMQGQMLAIPLENNGSDPHSTLRFDGASGDLDNDFFVGNAGPRCEGTIEVTPGSNLDFNGAVSIGDGEAIGLVDFQNSATIRLNRTEPIMIADGSSLWMDGIVEGYGVKLKGDYAAANVRAQGGYVTLQDDLDIMSLDTFGQSTLTIADGALVNIGDDLTSDIYDLETDTVVKARDIITHYQTRIVMSATPQTATPVLSGETLERMGDFTVYGDERVDGSNLGQIWPLVASMNPMGGQWWNGGKMVDDDPNDGITYILHQDNHKISVEILAELAGDTDGDGDVDVDDVMAVLAGFRNDCLDQSPVQVYCPSDVDRSGRTDVNDLLQCIANFG